MLLPDCTTPKRSVCFNCRRLSWWREQRGLPDICPHSFTITSLPAPPLPPANLPQPTERDRALQAAARGEVYAPPGRCKGCGG
jgi:hypothetical protein